MNSLCSLFLFRNTKASDLNIETLRFFAGNLLELCLKFFHMFGILVACYQPCKINKWVFFLFLLLVKPDCKKRSLC